MEIITVENICRLCLTQLKLVSEPLSNWIDDVLLIFGLEVFLDDGFPQQVCSDCSHTLMITAKLKDTVYKADMLLKTYHKTNTKPKLENDCTNFGLNNAINELSETVDIKINICDERHSDKNTRYEIDETLDVKFNFPISTSIDMVDMNSQPIIKSELRVMLEKLPDYISSTSSIYCSICLLAFSDSDRYNIHLNLNIHNTNKCNSCCMIYQNAAQLWKHVNSVHVDGIIENEHQRHNDEAKMERYSELTIIAERRLNEERYKKKLEYDRKRRANMTEEQRKKQAEYDRKRRANMTEEQRKKLTEYERKRRANMTEEQKKKQAEKDRQRYASMTEEQKKKRAEYYGKHCSDTTDLEQMKKAEYYRKWYNTEERRKKRAEYYRKKCADMTDEQRKKKAEYCRTWRANMTEEQRTKRTEYLRQQRANMTEEQRKKRSEYYHNKRSNITEEQRKKRAEYLRQQRANMTEEQRKKRAEYERKRLANLKLKNG